MKPHSLNLYAVFHLNLMYSSIEVEQRPQVIQRCYWPLLRLVQRTGIPLGIEASGYTLEQIALLDPAWMRMFRELVSRGTCEFVGCGYAQLIGPLVPAQVNRMNHVCGHEVYERLVGMRPCVALVSEQAYSAGLIEHYRQAGYRAIIMDWEKPSRQHPEWNPEWRYYPQYVCGPQGEQIALIWNKSLAFQKFQRYAHGEMDWQSYEAFLCSRLSTGDRSLAIYGNDAEIFDFRPSRYRTEPGLCQQGEWERIEHALIRLQSDDRFRIIRPSEVLAFLVAPEGGRRLQLEAAENPIPVKKQVKYNIIRWAVTGRDDAGSNQACWRIYEALCERGDATDDDWKALCYLWSSDFRTHITRSRWMMFLEQLRNCEARLGIVPSITSPIFTYPLEPLSTHLLSHQQCRVEQTGSLLRVETPEIILLINCRRGLAIDGLWNKAIPDASIIGTLPHGYYDDIEMGADYYSGHVVLEAPAQPKVTDLSEVNPEIRFGTGEDLMIVGGTVETNLGPIQKRLVVERSGAVRLAYRFDWKQVPAGAFRLGYVTLNPEAFDPDQLAAETHNGGYDTEVFRVGERTVDHGRPVSFLVSATTGFGMTGGSFVIGDDRLKVHIEHQQAHGYVIPLLTCFKVGESYFCRACFSATEFDDTSADPIRPKIPREYMFRVTTKLHGVDGLAMAHKAIAAGVA